jgi:hypothetical protein
MHSGYMRQECTPVHTVTVLTGDSYYHGRDAKSQPISKR